MTFSSRYRGHFFKVDTITITIPSDFGDHFCQLRFTNSLPSWSLFHPASAIILHIIYVSNLFGGPTLGRAPFVPSRSRAPLVLALLTRARCRSRRLPSVWWSFTTNRIITHNSAIIFPHNRILVFFCSGRLCSQLRAYGGPPTHVYHPGLGDMHRFADDFTKTL